MPAGDDDVGSVQCGAQSSLDSLWNVVCGHVQERQAARDGLGVDAQPIAAGQLVVDSEN